MRFQITTTFRTRVQHIMNFTDPRIMTRDIKGNDGSSLHATFIVLFLWRESLL